MERDPLCDDDAKEKDKKMLSKNNKQMKVFVLIHFKNTLKKYRCIVKQVKIDSYRKTKGFKLKQYNSRASAIIVYSGDLL